MAIDFTLTGQQRELQCASRKFAKEVLAEAKKAELLVTPEERFLATKPTYEAMVAAGYLRKCIPAPAGGDNAGLIDMAILAEEFYSVNPSVTLTMLGTVLGLLPVLLGGTPDQCKRLLVPFLKTSGAPLAGFCSSEPGGSANAASPPPGEGVRTTARREGDNWVINGRKKWCPRPQVGTAKAPMFCALCAELIQRRHLTQQSPSLPWKDRQRASYSNVRLIRSVIGRISSRNSAFRMSRHLATICWGRRDRGSR
jgi:alkylation response protein AidB-like acyl-CoA dehydrogenase